MDITITTQRSGGVAQTLAKYDGLTPEEGSKVFHAFLHTLGKFSSDAASVGKSLNPGRASGSAATQTITYTGVDADVGTATITLVVDGISEGHESYGRGLLDHELNGLDHSIKHARK